MTVYAAMKDDAHQGWVWLKDSNLQQRSIIKIISTINNKKRSVYCEALQIDENFIDNYNDSSERRVNIKKSNVENVIVIGEWYREKLGGINTKSEIQLEIVPANNKFGKLQASRDHPQAVVRQGIALGLLGAVLGIAGAVLGMLSLYLAMSSQP